MKKLLLLILVTASLLEVCLSRRGGGRREKDRESHRGGVRKKHARQWDDMSMMDPGFLSGLERGRYRFGFGPRRNPWFGVDFSWGESPMSEPWWKGPNVCFSITERLENDTAEISSHFSFQSMVCDGSDTTFKCTKTKTTLRGKETTVELHECCPGFTREQEDFGCTKEVPLYDIPTLMENLELGELTSLMESSGLTQQVLSSDNSNLTIFAPTNEALKSYLPLLTNMASGVDLKDFGSVVMVSQEISDAVVDNTRNLLLGHVAVGHLTSSQLSDNKLIETASPLKTSIRINIYQTPVKLVTANCKRVAKADNLASNGVIHVVSEVLKPVTDTLMELIQKNPELSTLKTALGSSRLASVLRNDGQFTLFAPTDTAFKNHQVLMTKIMSDQECIENVLKNHLLPNVICSAVVEGEARTSNSLDKHMNLTRDADGKLYVDGAQIVTSDIMATNGVLYIIDDVLIPDEALTILQLAEKKELVEFGKLVDLAGMKKELNIADNVTVFVPSNEAIKALSPDVLKSFSGNPDALKKVLQYHIVPDMLSCRKFYNNLQLDTLEGTKLRVNEYSSFPFGRHWTQTIQCANLDRSSIKGCNGAVYVIDKVLIPPTGNVIDILAQDSRFSTLVQLVKIAGIADMLQETGPFTVFAPTNEVFDNLGSDAVAELKQNAQLLKSTLLNHVTKDTVCCAGVMRANWFDSQKVRTLSGEVFPIGKTRRGGTYISNSNILQCDLMATNGVIHVIDNVITSANRPTRLWDQPHDLFDWVWDF